MTAFAADNVRMTYDWTLFARDNQLEPPGKWNTWLLLGGRGFGKTRTAAEWVRSLAERGLDRRIALLGRTSSDVRDVMIEGESGLLSISPPWFKPVYEPSKRRLTWPNGVIATTFSADEPDMLRGPQFHAAWCDELAAFKNVAAWDNLRFGLRLGRRPRVVVSTTPRPTDEIRALVKDPTTHVTRGSTYENKRNLAPDFLSRILAKYEGTRLGDQEIHAMVLDDTEGALWTQALVDASRADKAPEEFKRIVVAVDPAVTSKATSDETGIVTVGLDWEGRAWVLDDDSGLMKAEAWALKAIERYNARQADLIVGEVNNGGDLIEVNLRAVHGGRNVPFKAVHASRGKAVRAEPVASLYEQGKVKHVGRFAQLESQMTTFVPGVTTKSPDRMDALVWGLTELMLGAGLEFMSMDLDVGERSAPHLIE